MKQHHLLVLLIVACLAIGAGMIYFQSTREPKFEGRKLSEWISLIDVPAQRWTNPLVREAIQTIGPEALPFLIQSISAPSSRWYRLKIEMAEKFPFFREYPQTAHIQLEQNIAAFGLLGHRAEPALPELCNLLNRQATTRAAGRALANIGTEKAILELAKVLTNQNARIFKFEPLQMLRFTGPSAKPAMPILVQLLETDLAFADIIVHAMEGIDQNETIAVLQRLTTNSQPRLRMLAQSHLKRLDLQNPKAGPK